MSVEDRLYALAQQCRQQSGDTFLLTPSQLIPRLNSQAPDLHAEIRALAGALEAGAAARIAASANPEGDAIAIATEIATRERISMISATAAVVVARRIGPLAAQAAAPIPAPAAGGWAGDSLAVGAPPQAPAPQAPPNYHPPAQQAYAQPQPGPAGYYQQPPAAPAAPAENQTDKMKALAKNPLAMGALALVLGVLVYQNFLRPQGQQTYQDQGQGGGGFQDQGQGGQGQGGQGQGGQGQGGGVQGGGGGAQMPLLQAPGSGGPTLQVQRHQSGAPAFVFLLQTPQGAAPGMVMLPQGGWQSGPAGIGLAAPGDTTGQNITTGGEGQFQLVQSGGHPVRLAQIQMQQDALNTGGLCLMFRGAQGAQDVQLSGADFCVMNSSCSQPIGCGKLQ